jgi:hypothetical protein
MMEAAPTNVTLHFPVHFCHIPARVPCFLFDGRPEKKPNDKLPWTAFRWNEGIIRIEATQFFRPKTYDIQKATCCSIRSCSKFFRDYHARAKGEFVTESAAPADPAALYDHYRCHRDIQELIAWLRSKGVPCRCQAPSMRKQLFSL